MGWSNFSTGLLHYGPDWRAHRRIFQRFFKPEAMFKFRQVRTKKSIEFLCSLLDSPKDFAAHIRTWVLIFLYSTASLIVYTSLPGAIIVATIYGHDISPKDDYFVKLAQRASQSILVGIAPSTSLFYEFPILRFLPAYFPGAGFKRIGLEGRKVAFELRDIPIKAVQRNMMVIQSLPLLSQPYKVLSE